MNSTHGLYRAPEHEPWHSMLLRCCNPKNKDYHRYGGRGIHVCPAWKASFVAFLRDVGPMPFPKMTLDRIDNSKGYEPGNVRWATRKAQANNRRTNHFVTFEGRTMTVQQWSEELGMPKGIISGRLKCGWPVAMAFTHPVMTPEQRTQWRLDKKKQLLTTGNKA